MCTDILYYTIFYIDKIIYQSAVQQVSSFHLKNIAVTYSLNNNLKTVNESQKFELYIDK